MSIRAAFFVFVLVLTCEAFQQIWNDIRAEIGGASKMPLKQWSQKNLSDELRVSSM